jgi:D-3-phosphoglycerate dehydrogenase / 2-oxoglutarate reductase
MIMSSRYRVIATNPLHPEAEEVLRASYDYEAVRDGNHEALRNLIVDAHGIIVRTKLPDDIFNQSTKLLACVRHGVGLDFIPVAAATTANIPVANLLEANKQAVIEHVVATALMLARNYHSLESRFRSQGWTAREGYAGFELAGKTLGVVGCGRIGRGVAAAMQAAFGMAVIGYDVGTSSADVVIKRVELAELFSQADIVTLHLPSTPETRGMVDAKLLSFMKKGALLINAARGDLVIEDDLLSALASGRPTAAAIDVFESEPLALDHPYFKAENLFLTPHIAGGTQEAALRMSMQSVEAIDRILHGKEPASLVNAAVWPAHLQRLKNMGLGAGSLN